MQRKLADRIATIAVCAIVAASATATPAAAQTPRWLSGLFGGRASTAQDDLAPSQRPLTTTGPTKAGAEVAAQAASAVAQSARSPTRMRAPRWLSSLFGGRTDSQSNYLTAPPQQLPAPVLQAKADAAPIDEAALLSAEGAAPPEAETAPALGAERGDDINRIVLSALACPTPTCAAEGVRGSALIALASQDAATPEQQLVDEAFRGLMAPIWSEEQQQAIVLIGYYSAAAAICDGQALSADDVAAVVQANFVPPPGAPSDQRRYRRDALSMHIGIATGMAMGAHIASMQTFCAEARANDQAFATPLIRVEQPLPVRAEPPVAEPPVAVQGDAMQGDAMQIEAEPGDVVQREEDIDTYPPPE